jgi:hypothetical protein
VFGVWGLWFVVCGLRDFNSVAVGSAEEGIIKLIFTEKDENGIEMENNHTYQLISGILELLQYVVLERKLSIAVFSSASASHNELLIPIILDKANKAFPDSHPEILRKSPIFSRHHLSSRSISFKWSSTMNRSLNKQSSWGM